MKSQSNWQHGEVNRRGTLAVISQLSEREIFHGTQVVNDTRSCALLPSPNRSSG